MKFHFNTAEISLFVYLLLGLLYIRSSDAKTELSSDLLLAMADSLYQYQNYHEAITEYKRFIFFHPQSESVPRTFYKTGLAYQQNGDYEKSIYYFLQALEICSEEPMINRIRLSNAISNIAIQNYNMALFEVQKLLLKNVPDDVKREIFMLACIIMVHKENWNKARSYLEKFERISTNTEMTKIDSLIQRGERLPVKSEKLARVLSGILPGCGQLYTNHRFDAMNAFLINSLTFSFNIQLVKMANYVDATLFFLYVTLRFYRGNLYNAANHARTYNTTKLHDIEKKCTYELFKLLKEQ